MHEAPYINHFNLSLLFPSIQLYLWVFDFAYLNMKNLATSFHIAFLLVISFAFFSSLSHVNSCNGLYQTLDDCNDQLICINGRWTDDPQVGTHICRNLPPSPCGGGCQPSGTMSCNKLSYPKYNCSPPVTSSTRATLTNNYFSKEVMAGAHWNVMTITTRTPSIHRGYFEWVTSK